MLKTSEGNILDRMLGLTLLVLLTLAVFALLGLNFVGVPFVTLHFFRTQDLPAALLLVLFVIAMRQFLPALARKQVLDRLMRTVANLPVWPIALAVFLFTLASSWLLLGNYPLSMDEFWARSDGVTLASGHPMARISAEWREYAPALQPMYSRISPDGYWISQYLPVNAAIQAILGPLSGPLSAALSVLIAADLARRLLPGHKSAPIICAVMMASSSQLLLMAMTPYAMNAHLTFNLAWLWLFLRPERWAQASAMAVAILAIGLHQAVFFPLYAAPFLLEAFIAGRRGAALVQGVVIGAGFLFWGAYDALVYSWLNIAPPGDGDAGVILMFERFLGFVAEVGLGNIGLSIGLISLNLIRWILWQNLLAVPLLLAIAWPVIREGGVWRGMLAGIVFTTALMLTAQAFQGHGWGYRYLHGMLGSLCLLATYAWIRLKERANCGRELQALFVAALVLSLALIPARAWLAGSFNAPYLMADRALQGWDADVVIIDAPNHYFSVDLIRNDPFLANRPKRMELESLTDEQLVKLCTRYRVTVFTDADAERFGLTARDPIFDTETKRKLPAACGR